MLHTLCNSIWGCGGLSDHPGLPSPTCSPQTLGGQRPAYKQHMVTALSWASLSVVDGSNSRRLGHRSFHSFRGAAATQEAQV